MDKKLGLSIKKQASGHISSRKSVGQKFMLFIALSLSNTLLMGQCAMCRAVVEQGGEEVAEGINSGIVYLMAFPYLLVAGSMFLFYRNWKKSASLK